MVALHWSVCVGLLVPIVLVVVVEVSGNTDAPHAPHHHGGGLQDFDGQDEPGNQLRREGFVENKEHIEEHLRGEIKIDMSNASPEELEFHFFQIHDLDENSKLDGIELLHAISHGLEEQINRINTMSTATPDEKKERMERIKARHISAVDLILKDDDRDKDGYITWPEYAQSRKTSRILRHSGEQKKKREELGV